MKLFILILFTLSLCHLCCCDARGDLGSFVENLTIHFDDGGKYVINWTRFLDVLSRPIVQQMWEEAKVFEDLKDTYNKTTDLYEPPQIRLGNLHENNHHCQGKSQTKVNNISQIHSIRDAYLGNFEIPSRLLFNDDSFPREKNVTFDSKDQFFYFFKDYTTIWTWGNEPRISGGVTPSFSYATMANKRQIKEQITILFGESFGLPALKGFVNYPKVQVAKYNNLTMVVLASKTTGIGSGNLTKLFINIVEQNPAEFIEDIQSDFMAIDSEGGCGNDSMDERKLLLFFRVVVSHFKITRTLQKNYYVNMSCISTDLADLDLLREMISKCFTSGYNLSGFSISTIATQQLNTFFPKLAEKGNVGYADTIFNTLILSRGEYNVTEDVVRYVKRTLEDMYMEFSYTFTLSGAQRTILFKIWRILNTFTHDNHMVNVKSLITSYILMSSMCTNGEIGLLVDKFSRHPIDIHETFTPCFMSLRFDFSVDKLQSNAPQKLRESTTKVNTGTFGFLRVLHDFHKERVRQVPEIQCIHKDNIEDNIIAVIPLTNVTYVLSSDKIENVLTYEITEVFLKSGMFLSVLRPDCARFPEDHGIVLSIPVIYNVSNPTLGCPFCDSAVISYDESIGLESMMYINNTVIQKNLFLDVSPFFDGDNLHVHYLWLMNNGTVVEIRGAYRKKVYSIILFIMIFNGFTLMIYFLYKMLSNVL
nr:glycoprotein H [Bovine gammaherpesvirus 4]